MRKIWVIITFLVCYNYTAMAQYFAPLGATWHYTHRYLGPATDFNKLEVVDTAVFINGRYCSKIKKTISVCSPEFEYVYCDQDVVFKLNQISNTFDTLYNFNLNAGEGWADQIIDSVVFVNINGNLLKGLYVNGNTIGGPILERIGSPASFISDNLACDPIDGGWIRCYSDHIIGLYKVSEEDCEAEFVSTYNGSEKEISIFPNPTKQYFTIKNWNHAQIDQIFITDPYGKVMQCQKNITDPLRIDNLPNGLYLIQITGNNKILHSAKLLIE